jgi:hypothetical protein
MGHSTAQTTEHYLESLDLDKTLEIDNGLLKNPARFIARFLTRFLARIWG